MRTWPCSPSRELRSQMRNGDIVRRRPNKRRNATSWQWFVLSSAARTSSFLSRSAPWPRSTTALLLHLSCPDVAASSPQRCLALVGCLFSLCRCDRVLVYDASWPCIGAWRRRPAAFAWRCVVAVLRGGGGKLLSASQDRRWVHGL